MSNSKHNITVDTSRGHKRVVREGELVGHIDDDHRFHPTGRALNAAELRCLIGQLEVIRDQQEGK